MDVDQAIEAAEVNIEFYEYNKACKEPPWDGELTDAACVASRL
jgi:hypothetical protein